MRMLRETIVALALARICRPRGDLATSSHCRRRAARPDIESLEDRVNPSTYLWTALGDGLNWNDASNWQLLGSPRAIAPPTVPTPFSDVVFPPIASLPKGSSTTINFNFVYLYMPVNSITIDDSYTFVGNPIKVESSLTVANPFTTAASGANAEILLDGLELAPGVAIGAGTGSTLELGSASDLNGVQLTLLGSVTKSGPGRFVIDTQNVAYPNIATLLPIPVTIASGSLTLATSLNLRGLSFTIKSQAGLVIADNVEATVQSIFGAGLINLAGTTTAGDQTSLTVTVPNASTDQFNGLIDGTGQLVMSGNGTLSTGAIDFSGAGSIQVTAGTLAVNGTISAGTLQVFPNATFGGLGMWTFSGAVVFQPRSTFDVALDGTSPGSQYTQLVDTSAAFGVDLGYSTLAGSFAYEYEQGDQFTVVIAPVVTNAFQNVVNGRLVISGGVPIGVTATSTAVGLSPLQSVTNTELHSSLSSANPGTPVTFTASVSTRTSPVTAGSISFVQGTNVLAVVALDSGGSASWTSTSLPLGSNAIFAVYTGFAAMLSSVSSTVTITVVPYSTVTMLASSSNPSVLGRSVTLTASVSTTGGSPVIGGTVSFRSGSRLLGIVTTGSAGMAMLPVSQLAIGTTGIQAVYSGTADDLGSVSAVVKQQVGPAPTVTTFSISTQATARGGVRFILVADVSADGEPSLTPTGIVVFRRNGHSLGSARLKGGLATLVVRGKPAKSSAKFVALFQKNTRFRASRSTPVEVSG